MKRPYVHITIAADSREHVLTAVETLKTLFGQQPRYRKPYVGSGGEWITKLTIDLTRVPLGGPRSTPHESSEEPGGGA